MLKDFLEENKKNTIKSIEKFIKRKTNSLDNLFSKDVVPDYNAINYSVIDPIYDLIDRGGKRIRPALMYLCYKATKGKDQQLINDFLVFPEIIHNASLIHDDIEDRADIRRGKKAIHKIYGEDVAINCASSMYFLPLSLVFEKIKDPIKRDEIFKLYSFEMKAIHLGQASDIFWHNGKSTDLNFEKYIKMCECKTGVLTRLSAKLGCILSNADEKTTNALYTFAQNIGVAFQIKDDILDLECDKCLDFKELHGMQDIKEGKRTLIVIHTLENADSKDKNRLLEILDKDENTNQEILEAIDILKKYKSIDYAKEVSKKLVIDAYREVDKYLEESKYKSLLKEFADYLVKRDF